MQAIANRIVIGELSSPILTFDNSQIREISSETAASLIGDELFIDQFNAVVEHEPLDPQVFKPTNYTGIKEAGENKIFTTAGRADLRTLPYGTRVTFYSDNKVIGEYFSKSVERIGKTTYKLNAMSAIGLMDRQYHMGGMYTGQFFPAVLADIIGASGEEYEYVIDNITALRKMRIYGWLPHSTRRRNLHQLLTAFGVSIVKNDAGKMRFCFIEDTDPLVTVADSAVFAGGSVAYNEPASRVELAEHMFRYDQYAEEEVLFDNTQDGAVTSAIVSFDKPVYPASVRCSEGNLTIVDGDVGVNYARVTGTGILVGKPYLHTTKILSADNSAQTGIEKRVVKMEDCTLVTLINSENVLARLQAYYFNATVVTQDIIPSEGMINNVKKGARVGQRCQMNNAYHEQVNGYITRMSTRVTSFQRATCEIIQNYTPTGQGVNYPNHTVFPLASGASTEWSIPDSVFQKDKPYLRVVLIGCGYDGTAGSKGQDGTGGDDHDKGLGGAGGAGGKGGLGGKIRTLVFDAQKLGLRGGKLRFYTGGTNNKDSHVMLIKSGQTSGSYYTSAYGTSLSVGFYDPANDTTYGLPGQDGIDGGAGGDAEVWKHTNGWERENKAKAGESVVYNGTTYQGGATSSHRDQFTYTSSSYRDHPEFNNCGTVFISYSGGGGAAKGAAGGAGFYNPSAYYSTSAARYAGTGGNGANAGAAAATSSVYGSGGNGGHGGGGGGGSPCREWVNLLRYSPDEEPWDLFDSTPTMGKGGNGSAGTTGQYGCAILFY